MLRSLLDHTSPSYHRIPLKDGTRHCLSIPQMRPRAHLITNGAGKNQLSFSSVFDVPILFVSPSSISILFPFTPIASVSPTFAQNFLFFALTLLSFLSKAPYPSNSFQLIKKKRSSPTEIKHRSPDGNIHERRVRLRFLLGDFFSRLRRWCCRNTQSKLQSK